MRKLVLAVMVALFAMVSFSCGEASRGRKEFQVGKYVGTISTMPGWAGILVYEHEGNLIYQTNNGIAVVPKRASEK